VNVRRSIERIDDRRRMEAEAEIRLHQKEVDYQTKDFTVELLVHKYITGADDDENEIFVPQYQRKFVWDKRRQSKFIESVILGLPVPYIFIANLEKTIGDDEGRAEIVDGSQRIRTLHAFLANDLRLENLEKLPALNGFYFKDLDVSRQRKFNRQPVRVIELSDKADEKIRRDLFERINTGSDELRDMEKRKGTLDGPFYEFIKSRAQDPKFRALCPLSHGKERREEYEELVLRYFAYSDGYLSFKHDVQKFLTGYFKANQKTFDSSKLKKQFDQMVRFTESSLPYGFKKTSSSNTTPRVRFEAIACGITLALRINPKLTATTASVEKWLTSEEFRTLVTSDASNSLPKLKSRIEFVRDKLLGE
jgi:uncharacterized protein with ParB-like and HNH nuclease domain